MDWYLCKVYTDLHCKHNDLENQHFQTLTFHLALNTDL